MKGGSSDVAAPSQQTGSKAPIKKNRSETDNHERLQNGYILPKGSTQKQKKKKKNKLKKKGHHQQTTMGPIAQ